MNKLVYFLIFSSMCLAGWITSCAENERKESYEIDQSAVITSVSQNYDDFRDYWYQGKAEISSYQLEQLRYGEVHPGHAVLVFVTEDFSKNKQVKLDFSPKNGDERVPVLKLNFVKKFNTGIYPYSMMQSVFSPVDIQAFPHSIKTSMSAQEWCGHTFTQFNLQKKAYNISGYSYFESEGDIQKEIPLAWLEDEIWTRIRINPESLPTGTLDMIPGSFYLRLRHQEFKVEKAEISKQVSEEDPQVVVYSIFYPTSGRKLSIQYERIFPYNILGWEEEYQSRLGSGPTKLKTKATLMKQIKSAYWNRHRLADTGLRKELGID